jgi:hypothetical protein
VCRSAVNREAFLSRSLARSRGVFFLSKYCTASNNILTAHVEEANEIFILSRSQNREMFIFCAASCCARSSSKAPVNSRSRQLAQLHCPPSCLSHRELHFMNWCNYKRLNFLALISKNCSLFERAESIFRAPFRFCRRCFYFSTAARMCF